MDTRGEKLEYLKHCVSENLNHARHVENERLTFTSIYIAMVIGAVAAVFAMDDRTVAIIVAGFLVGFGLMAMLLNMRWQGVFDDHIRAAEQCQENWRTAVEAGAMPVLPEKKKDYYYGGYGEAATFGRKICRLLFGSPARETQSKGLIKELGRTRRIFALLYLVVFVALVGLFVFLCNAEDYGGFFFADEVIDRLEDAIGLIVEETQK
ncbi:MAG: hypothetical protein IKU58_03695 [Clostridia bacterium]|nr:hypothetical protein [Clostridia bacterium]